MRETRPRPERGGTARNIFVVLDGTLEVLDDNRVVDVLSTGDAFGELERPRAFDVDAATEHTRTLSLSEGALRKMIAEDPTVAAKLLLNLSRMLCVRLIKANSPVDRQPEEWAFLERALTALASGR